MEEEAEVTQGTKMDRPMRLLLDSFWLMHALIDLVKRAEEQGGLCRGHRLLRITAKAIGRFHRRRKEVGAK